jgi:hypothetical protein
MPQLYNGVGIGFIPTLSEPDSEPQPQGAWSLVAAVHQETRVPHKLLFGNELLRLTTNAEVTHGPSPAMLSDGGAVISD